jgi:hypothetical protein
MERKPTEQLKSNGEVEGPVYSTATHLTSRSISQKSSVNSSSLNDTPRFTTVIQKIMTDVKNAVSEGVKTLAIIKIVSNPMKQNGC